MTTNAHRRHLSLASTIAIEEVQAIMAATRNVHRHVFVLKSVLSTSNVVNRHLFDEWIASLLSGEHVEFMHTRIQSSATSYRFSVVACSSRPDHVEFARRAGQALAAVCAPIHFGYVGEAVTQAAARHWQVELAPVVLATRDVLVASRDKPAQRDDEDYLLPFPGELPSWGLSYMLTEFLDLPREVTITIRLFPFMLSKVDTERTVSLKRRLVNGGLHVFEPGVTRAEYAASPELAEPLSRLLTEWIRRPAGYSVDCVLSADEPLPTQALKRLASDVFGKRPVTIHEVTASTLRAPLAFTAAVRADQGIPGLFPALPILPSYGIERHYPAPERMPPSIGGAVLAQTVCGARSTAVTIPDASRSQHVAFFGATGSGKSTAMLRLLSDDMNSPARHGIVVIDPHGSLVHDVLGLVPRDRAQDVVLIDVTDGESVTSFNPLEGMADDPQFARLMADSVQSLIDALFEARDSSGPSMRAHLRSLLLLGTCYKPVGETFMNVQRCIEDVEFFDYLRSKCKDRNVLNGISVLQQSGSSEHGWKAWAPYLMARLSPFVDSPAMKRLINNPQPSVDFNRAVTDGKILLCNISKSVLGETESRIVGNLVLSRVFAAAVKRGALFDRSTRPINLYIDELATFASDTLPRMLAEARKFGLHLVTANQSLDQLRNQHGQATIGRAILANAATKVMLRLGPSDIGLLAPYFKPQFEALDMAVLPDMHAVVSLQAYGAPLPPFVARISRPQHDDTEHARSEDIVSSSRLLHGEAVEVVNKRLAEQYDLPIESLGSVVAAKAPAERASVASKSAPVEYNRRPIGVGQVYRASNDTFAMAIAKSGEETLLCLVLGAVPLISQLVSKHYPRVGTLFQLATNGSRVSDLNNNPLAGLNVSDCVVVPELVSYLIGANRVNRQWKPSEADTVHDEFRVGTPNFYRTWNGSLVFLGTIRAQRLGHNANTFAYKDCDQREVFVVTGGHGVEGLPGKHVGQSYLCDAAGRYVDGDSPVASEIATANIGKHAMSLKNRIPCAFLGDSVSPFVAI